MTELTKISRPDVDIEADIQDVIAHYPPLQSDWHHLHIAVNGGVVDLSGHTRSQVSRTYLIEKVEAVRGVQAVVREELYDEDTIRREAGRRTPTGVFVNARYGTVILTGSLPEGVEAAQVVNDVAQIAGVQQVVTKFE